MPHDFSPSRVSDNKRFLLKVDGTPFFYLADTGWTLFHRLSFEEADEYLRDRAAKKFTVIQVMGLAEHGGLSEPNRNGDLPFENNDTSKPNEKYFAHMDRVVNRAKELGLVIGMLPTWGEYWNKKWGRGPELFTPENARAWGEFFGRRYAKQPVIWILGGDRPVESEAHRQIIRNMVAGLKAGDGGRHLMTFHPNGGQTSSQWWHNEAWLDFNMLQSGHRLRSPNYQVIAKDYALQPVKPCLDGEPGYEDHPIDFKPENGYFDDYAVRQFAYWSLFAGACGHTYGCHDIWQFLDTARRPAVSSARLPWQRALHLAGAGQMQFARNLIESRPVLERIPDQTLLVSNAGSGSERVQATRGQDGSYAFVYSAAGKPFTVDLSKLSGEKLNVFWFNPRRGEASPGEQITREGKKEFTPPSDGVGHDWVLVLDDAAKNYTAPGR